MAIPFLIASYVLITAFGYWLRWLNLRHLKRYGSCIPSGFEGEIDSELLRKSSAYTVEQSRLGLWESLFDSGLLLLFLFGGILPFYDRWVLATAHSFLLQGLLFFIPLMLVLALLEAPFSLYGTFRIESRYGFNTTTLRLWLSDLLKSTAIGLVLFCLVGSGAFALVSWSPHNWWLWVWGLFAAVSLFLMYLSPYLIEPLFNKFEPIRDKELEEEIVALVARAEITVSRVMQVDASKRSRHSNAYFTGIGKVKRIVLYDTLLEQMTRGEILAILAHEVGHWKRGHIWKRLLVTEVGAGAVLYTAYLLLSHGVLPPLFGLAGASFPAQLIMLSFLGSIVSFPLGPIGSWLSRRHEWEADEFAVQLSGRGAELASALVKLSKENLANLHPHPLYAGFYYSHPPVVERVGFLRKQGARGE